VVVVLSVAEYERVTGKKPNFIEYLLNAPDMSDLDLTRDKTPLRDYDWGGEGE
jgi:hypothetical protein